MSTPPFAVPVTSEPLSLIDRLNAMQRAMKPDELAALLQVSRLTIIRMAKKGIIPSFRIGGCVRFDPRLIALCLKKRGAWWP